tara:strand:- start:23 stop:424 length:402 start_codon:yes stop_codon:yes gene_type:complete
MKYEVNDKVIINNDGTNEVAVITNLRSAKNGGGYDIRSEKGSGYIMVPEGRPRNKYAKTYPWVDVNLTDALAGKISTNLFAKEGVGHTRANYSKDIPLYFDGESEGSDGANTLVRQMEKYNNFHFPPQGPRSF